MVSTLRFFFGIVFYGWWVYVALVILHEIIKPIFAWFRKLPGNMAEECNLFIDFLLRRHRLQVQAHRARNQDHA